MTQTTTRQYPPAPRFVLYGRHPDGSILELFRWCRGEKEGIAQAWHDAEHFGVELEDIWAIPLQ